MGLSCRSPDSWCRRFNVDNASLKSEPISHRSDFSRLIERDQPILFVSKIFGFRHVMREILVGKIVHFNTNFFISIMFEHGCTKFRTSQKAIVDPLKTLLDASLFFKLWAIKWSRCSVVFPYLWQ